VTNRPKDIGTRAETAVVRAARVHGFPGADRLTLTGAKDRGDVSLCPGVIVEVKGGERARTASDRQIEAWLVETERERVNAGADVAFLVTQRAGFGPERAALWWAHLRLVDLDAAREHDTEHALVGATTIRLHLADALFILRCNGYGDRPEVAA